MGRTLTNNFNLQYAIEETVGVLPTTPEWKELEPNAVNTFGATITTVPRDPISKDRQRRKGCVTDLDSAMEFEADWTRDVYWDFIEGFCYARFQGPAKSTITAVDNATSTYTITPALDAAIPTGSLVYMRGCTLTANNGLKVVTGGSTTTVIVDDTLTDETIPTTQNASLETAGFRFASGTLSATASTLVSSSTDLTTLNIIQGMALWVGGDAIVNSFADTNNRGFIRVTTTPTATTINFDKANTTFGVDAGTDKLIDLFFGSFIKNTSCDDTVNYLEQSYQFEGAYKDLDSVGVDEYEYSKGNYCNTAAFNLPLTNKATITFGFIGTDTEPPSTTRATAADTPVSVVEQESYCTSSDIARLRLQEFDETGLSTDFKSLTLTINNNVSPEKVLGLIGARYMNLGNFDIDIEAQLLFTDSAIPAAVRENTTVTMDFAVKNGDGGIYVDIPSMTLSGGDREFPVNESILINTTAMAYQDTTYLCSFQSTMFAYLPAAIAS